MESKNIGKVVQIVGAVVDIRFEKDSLPDLLNAIEIDNKGEKLVVEVAQHIGCLLYTSPSPRDCS